MNINMEGIMLITGRPKSGKTLLIDDFDKYDKEKRELLIAHKDLNILGVSATVQRKFPLVQTEYVKP